jgi:hypothetical protein
MTNDDELLKLVERCEKAAGPSRKLDHAISVGTGRPQNWAGSQLPNYSASLDAAMTLVPEMNGQSAYPQIQRCAAEKWQAHLGYANKAKGTSGNAVTAPLALCAAALRAHAAQGHQ